MLSARADGYYLFQGSPNELILAPLANASVKLKSEDFQLVQMIGLAPLVIVARKDLPANNADELVKLARSRGHAAAQLRQRGRGLAVSRAGRTWRAPSARK